MICWRTIFSIQGRDFTNSQNEGERQFPVRPKGTANRLTLISDPKTFTSQVFNIL